MSARTKLPSAVPRNQEVAVIGRDAGCQRRTTICKRGELVDGDAAGSRRKDVQFGNVVAQFLPDTRMSLVAGSIATATRRRFEIAQRQSWPRNC